MGKKIIVLAYAVSPTRGSEYSIAWNYIVEMAKDNSLVVLYGASGSHLGDVKEIETWLMSNSVPNVRFVSVLPNKLTSMLNYFNLKGILPYTFYFAFRSWHRQVFDVAKILKENEDFDLVHYVVPSGFREPGYLWKLDLPYIWGPFAGIANRPKQLFNSLPFKTRIFFIIRNWANSVQFNYNHRLEKALKATDLLLTGTSETKELIEKRYKISSICIPEHAIVADGIGDFKYKEGDIFNILWIATIDARKSLNFLIEALGKIKTDNWQLHVLGDGPRKPAMKQLAEKMGISQKISWYGHIPRSEVFALLKSAHLHVITSLGEGTTTVLFEAMANGIPTITLNHCGMKDVVCEKCGVKIDLLTVDQVIDDISKAISGLIRNPEQINRLSAGVRECAKSYTWENRRKLFNGYYDLAIENRRKKS
jgi:glycosyltransferase involved in cell wall biosynthesis